LHNSSPWLLWWEVHEDVWNIERILEIENLKPDFICSDYISCYD
jgi:hypothetical protein